MTFTLISQVEEYIQDYLLKSSTFNLEKREVINTKVEKKTETFYFEKNSEINIYHLIFAYEGSEAGKYYNKNTLEFLEKSYSIVTDLSSFDIIQSVKERFIEISKEIIERTHQEKQLSLTDFCDNEVDNNKFIKLNDQHEITLKKCLIDELGFSNLKANGFEPTYNLFKKDNKIIVRIEAAGNSKLEYEIEFAGEYNIIKLRGEKKRDKEPINEKDNIFNTREYGSFSLEIPLKAEDYLLSNDQPTIENKKGILFLEYKLAQKTNKKGYETKEDDEI
jgi:HSP20 family molecular chaperone IbpA